jgi:VanZ family protein
VYPSLEHPIYAGEVVLTRLTTWGPAVLWAALIFALSSVPDLGTGLGAWDTALRKLAHVAEYAILGALVYRAAASVPLAILISSAYAATDEIHQAFVAGRHGSPLDWLIDTAGVLLGVVAAARLSR